MELIKKNIHMNKLKCQSNLQLNLHDDMNVPDSKPDIASVMKISGEMRIDEQKMISGKFYIRGALKFQLLYVSDEADHTIHSLTGKLNIDEAIHLDADCSIENAIVHWDIEDLTANVINSRKLSIRSLIQLHVTAEDIYDESVCIDTESDTPICTRRETIHVTGLTACKKDSYRLRDEITLPATKSGIRELLYHSANLKNIDIRLLQDQFHVKGELLVFFLYSPEDGDVSAEYYETELPFQAVIDCNGCNESMTPDITLAITDNSFEVRQDNDGEYRVLSVDALIEMQIKIYEEESMEIIRDLYSPSLSLTPVYRPVTYENLLVRNTNKMRLSEHSKLPDTAPKILQICHGSGKIHLDDTALTEEGILVMGIIEADVFYITSEDSRPMYAVKVMLPFEQLIEVMNLTPDSIYSITPELEQLTVLSSESDELEIKASILLNSLVFDRITAEFLTDVTEEPLDYDTLFSLPGMTGYIVREQDTLWDIAKNYHTTMESIIALNELDTDTPPAGTHLLLLKEILT